ncbi:aldo/keto reductase [Mycoplasmatota bacterium WC30]
MQYRKMPNSDEKLSVLGFGCMRLPTKSGGSYSGLIDKQTAKNQIRLAIDNGVNYLDTAFPYHMGASETFLGEVVLKDGYREKVKLATKLPCFFINKKEQIEEYFQKQLKKLQTDYFDYYLMHALNYDTWRKMVGFGIIEFMDKIRKEGKVKHIGFSFHDEPESFIKIVDEYNWEFAQVQYNIIDQHYQAGIEGIEYAHKKGLGIIIMEPLRGGALTSKTPARVLDIYNSQNIKRSPAEWALRWIWNNPMVTLILSGMNNEEHILENIRVANETLPNSVSKEDLLVVDSVKAVYDDLLQVNCTGCGYCMPCPAGINIPAAFKNLNDFHMFAKRGAKIAHLQSAGILTKDGKNHFTSVCIDCGACEQKCPQNIEIRKEFKHVKKHLEGPVMRMIAWGGRAYFSRKNRKKKKEA